MDTVIIVLSVLLFIFGYAIYNLVRKVETLEEQIEETIFDTKVKIRTALRKMRELDYNGSFEADDEVGTIFKDLKRTVEELDNSL